MDLTEYRTTNSEQQRTADLLRLMPASGRLALDIGARDGHFSLLMAERFDKVLALDLSLPTVDHPRVENVQGNAAKLPFDAGSFDLVLCAEVLEHVPEPILSAACREIERVAGDRILIGVPYRQDIRVDRTTCYSCGKTNPPYGHVNSFDEQRLAGLFPHCDVETISLVGSSSNVHTNALSAALMDLAGNPYGTYDQDETCGHCDRALLPPPRRGLARLIATRLAFWARKPTELLARPQAAFMHMVLRKPAASRQAADPLPVRAEALNPVR